ncbi:sulfite exporter TauE/SafE family protein [Siccirubricoccus phaeus]|uniref:sulfite exporter TauE/SafE family protein n=1 Tax=Siccirubricoccus phaeus TaxID=2595053 RepID=UPI001F2AC28D|nr:sulfite exporter TauE/SafE family protein [Siccirubricoccus phaeus]
MSDLLSALPEGPALTWLLVAALAGGLARGFSGFGAAMIFIPLASIGLGPRVAAPLMLAMESVAIALLTPGAWKLADRRQVGVMAIGSALGTPLGALALAAADQQALRWGVAALILAMLGLLASGWRFRGRPSDPVTVGVGVAGGVLGGIAMVSGPPIMAYLLGQPGNARQIRASFALYLAAASGLIVIAYAATGLLRASLVPPFLIGAPVYALGIWGGTRMFGLASDRAFRLACYGMIAVAALLGLPVWDGLWR